MTSELAKKVDRLEKLIRELVEAYNTHCHDVAKFEGYGLASYPPKTKFKGKRRR